MNESELKSILLDKLSEYKIEDLEAIDVSKKTSVANIIILGTGRSEKHIDSTMNNLRTDLKSLNIISNIKQSEGKSTNWMVLDLGNIIVHLFTNESRNTYKLEELWK